MRHKVGGIPPKTVAVVGLGLLGRGITTCLLGYGFRVVGFSRTVASHAYAEDYIEHGLADMVQHIGVSASLVHEWRDRYHATQSYCDWPSCDFVLESIDEDMVAKQAVFDEIENIVAPTVPIGSNTSAIPISQLQEPRRHPERFFGMHWFEPGHATRFLELIPGDQTSRATMYAATEIARRCGKEPSILAKDIPGFIVNRLAYAMYREALHLLEQGVADAETIDRSFRNACGVWSTVCGPFQWMDLTGGPALYGKAMRRVLPTLSNATELPKAMRQLVESEAKGINDGTGFYTYTPEQARKADELFHAHAWNAHKTMNEYFPMK